MWKEFRPAIRFVALFVGIYLVGNILYGLYISSNDNRPDIVTKIVAHQTVSVLNSCGFEVRDEVNSTGPTVFLKTGNRTILNVFEGCNGINVIIVFVSFLIAFRGPPKMYLWFIPAGVLIVHASNIVRIGMLYWVAVGHQRYFYYVHKYVFTGVIYLVVFALWLFWIRKTNGQRSASSN